MPRSAVLVTLLIILMGPAGPAAGQAPLTLSEAVARARRQNAEVHQADARVVQASASVAEAQARFWPRVDVAEGWQRSDLPVFAFSSLLSQRRFSAQDFDVVRLNQPDAIDNFRTALLVEQPVFDATTLAARRQAEAGLDMARVQRDRVAEEVVVATVEAFGQIQLLEAMAATARAALDSAGEDLRRAIDRRDAGLATDADVLMVTAYRAAAAARRIQTEADAAIARARLNLLMGEPLDTRFDLLPVDPPVAVADVTADDEADALMRRPDVRLAVAAERAAVLDLAAARAPFLPQVIARGGAEWNGATFDDRASGWMLGVDVRLNLFRGFGDRARLARARAVVDERRVARDAAAEAARLDVRAAAAALTAARARVDLAQQAVAAAREGQRITRERYDNGLASMADVLRAAESVLDADARLVAATTDRETAHARLQAALGEL